MHTATRGLSRMFRAFLLECKVDTYKTPSTGA
jgi:hypothetical protein